MATGQTSKEYFTVLTIIHGALLMVQILFGAIAYFLNSNGTFIPNNDLNGVFQIIVPVFGVGGITASTFVSKAQLKSVREKSDLKEKLLGYRTVLLVKLALLEAPALLSFVCFLLTGSYFFLAIGGLILVIFFMNRPTLQNLALELELNPDERKMIEDPNFIVG